MQVGFFADAGPLQLFVSNHLIPEDFSYDSANEPAFVSSDEAVRVQAGAEVRLRIVGTRVDADEIVRIFSSYITASASHLSCTHLAADHDGVAAAASQSVWSCAQPRMS